jgi:sRNA-binding carbon storage regulator CsrA
MLTLTRRCFGENDNEHIVIEVPASKEPQRIKVYLVEIRSRNRARIGIDAPPEFNISRSEHWKPGGRNFGKSVEPENDILKGSGLDFSPCRICGSPIYCIPDGLPVCVDCGKKEEDEG